MAEEIQKTHTITKLKTTTSGNILCSQLTLRTTLPENNFPISW